MTYTTRFTATALLLATAGCDQFSAKRSDSLRTALSEQQVLATQLQSQKDSLTRVVLDADAFMSQMDSAIKTVRGLPRGQRNASEDPLAAQVAARKEMMVRVNALVARAKSTANQLAELQQKQTVMTEQSEAQARKISEDAQMIADLGATIERQRTQITALEGAVDSLNTQMRTVGTRAYTAFYIVGTEKELTDKGVIVKEGGANLIVARPGRTLQPARVLDASLFTTIDQRETTAIPVPDSLHRYKLVSRQSLDAAEVLGREGTSFKGGLRITKPDEFWAPSRFLILVRQ